MNVRQIVTSLLLISRVVKVFILTVLPLFSLLFGEDIQRSLPYYSRSPTPTCNILNCALRNFRYLPFYCHQLLPHSLQCTLMENIQDLKLEDLSLNLHYALTSHLTSLNLFLLVLKAKIHLYDTGL